jgi:hypothetical protein
MSVLAAIRTHDVDLALVIHVGGAMILIGGLVTAVAATVAGWRDDAPRLRRFAVMTLLAVALPGWIVMRVGAEWIASKEDVSDANLSWVDVGFTTADGGVVLIVIGMVLAGLAIRRARRAAGSAGLARALAVLASVLLIAYLVAVWAMTTKPT